MGTSKRDAAVLIIFAVLSAAAFIAVLVFGIIQGIPGNGVYNHTIAEVSHKYPSDITPADYAFSIWGLIYLFQLAWIGYVFSTMCRANKNGIVFLNPVVLPKKYYILWTGSMTATVLWTFYFDAEELLISAILLVTTTVCGFVALISNLVATSRNENRLAYADLTCIRVLIQNGLDLFFSWTTLASLIGIAIALTYDPKSPKQFSQEEAGTICLYTLAAIILAWSIMENTVLYNLVKYLYSWYFVLIWGLTGVIVRYPDTQRKNTIITICLLCLSVVCLAAKITVSVLKPSRASKWTKKYKLLLDE